MAYEDFGGYLLIAAQSPAVSAEASATRVVRSDAEIRGLTEIARAWLARAPQILDPNVFLSSIDRNVWKPLVVVVSHREDVIGIAFFKERKIAGFATGIVYGDASLDGMVLSALAHRDLVLERAVQRLMKEPGIIGARLLVPPESSDLRALQKVRAALGFDLSYSTGENHCALELGTSYEAFLERLGHRTRRNFRYYRRRFEQSGHRFVPLVGTANFERAAADLLKKSVIGADERGVERALRILSRVAHPYLAGLQDVDGRWLAILGGWYEQDRMMVFFQMNNDKDCGPASLSLVLRTYVIGHLIENGVRTMTFWAGVGGPIRRYCVPVPVLKAFLDRRSICWSACRMALTSMMRRFPARVRWAADWIGD